MKIVNSLKDNTLLIVPNNMKKQIITEISKLDKMLNVKYISFEDIEKKIYSYDARAIHYLMKKYNYKYDVSKVYLENIRYIEDKTYNNKKLNKLVEMRKELLSQNLIKYNEIDDYQYENIVIYGYTYINNYRKKIIDSLNCKYKIEMVFETEKNINNKIYEFNNIKDEIIYVASKICELIKNGIDISKIKVVVEDNSYYDLINYLFDFFNLKTDIKPKTSLDVTMIGKYFIDHLDKEIEQILDEIKNEFDMNKQNNLLVFNEIIKIINNYEDKSIIKDMIIYDFKNTNINNQTYKNSISIISLYDSLINEDDYIFIMGFNQKIIPFINKDEGFLNDSELSLLGLETSKERNILEKNALISKIKTINNLTITYKLFDNNNTYLVSTLNDELGYEIIKDIDIEYVHSNKYNKINLSMLIDKLVKYSIYDKNLDTLYNNYSDINYLTYDNTYTKINKENLLKYLDNKLILSYTSLSNYYECSYKYYLSNILKLVPYEKTYMTLIGEVFHYILSISLEKDIDFDYEYDNFIKNSDFKIGPKEKFFFNKLKKELLFIIETIKEQYKHTSFNKALYEEKIIIQKMVDDIEVTFMGVIDKLMYKEQNNEKMLSIIDYKTGNTDIKLNNIIYGLDMQLPIYLYLAKNIDEFKDSQIIGFYLQKLLNSEVNKDYNKTYETLKRDKLKLNGYSIADANLLEEFDDSYNKSEVIKSMSTTNDGKFGHYAKILEENSIKKLEEIVEEKIENAIDNIKNANFSINPKIINKDNVSCKFCMFYDVCYVENKDKITLVEKNLDEILKEEVE